MRVKKSLRLGLAVCLAVLLTLLCSSLALASDVLDVHAEGAVSVTMTTSDGEAVGGGSLALYQVASIEEDESLQTYYAYTEQFAGLDAALLEDLGTSEFTQTVAAYAEDNGLSPVLRTAVDSEGHASFANLPVGIYLIVQTEAAEGYYAVSPFTVTVPLDVDGTLVYDVDATPKMEPVTPIPEEPETPWTPTIPQTGMVLWNVAALALCGVALLAVGAWLIRSGRRKHNAAAA